MQLTREQRAAFYCERTLNRTLADVTTAITIILETEDEQTVRQALRQRYKGMPVATILSIARSA